jgi:DNA-binding PadR family transcriptional regulator
MSTRLMILGLLKEKPYYGYELKRVMQQRYMDEWANVAFGSIYFALTQMTGEGLVEPRGTEKEGNRPSRTVYTITEPGKCEFFRLLREGWQKVDVPPDPFRVCLIFFEELPLEETISYLERRAEAMQQTMDHISAIFAELNAKGAPWMAHSLWTHDMGLCQQELAWLLAFLDDLKSGRHKADKQEKKLAMRR